MNIKTVGDLRNIIRQNGGSLVIGQIKIDYIEGSDIDIYFDDSLVQWYNSSCEDSDSLINEEAYNFTDSPSQIREKEGNSRKKLREAEEKIIELEKNIDKNNLTVGKVEAYENILLGRDLVLPKPKYV